MKLVERNSAKLFIFLITFFSINFSAGANKRITAEGSDSILLQTNGRNTRLDITSAGLFNFPGLTASRVLTTDGSSNLAASSVTTTTLGYLDATSSIQTQLDGKVDTTTNQSIAGDKTFTGNFAITGTTNTSKFCPAMNNTQRDLLTPVAQDCIYSTTDTQYQFYDGSAWAALGGGGAGGSRLNLLSETESYESGTDGTCSGSCVLSVETTNVLVTPENVQALSIAFSAASETYELASTYDADSEGTQAYAEAWIKTTATDAEFCIDIDSVESCVDIEAGDYRPYSIPATFGTTSASLKVKSGSASTIYIDEPFLGARAVPIANLGDAVESYSVYRQANFWDATGSTNDFDISLGTNSDNQLFIVEDSGGLTRIRAKREIDLTIAPVAANGTNSGLTVKDSSANIIGFQEISTNSLTATVSVRVKLSANDYVYAEVNNATSRLGGITITASSLNDHVVTPSRSTLSDPEPYTPTLAGVTSPTSVEFTQARVGKYLIVNGFFGSGTTSGTTFSISLPAGLTIDTNVITRGNTTAADGVRVGDLTHNNGTTQRSPIITATGTDATKVYIGGIDDSTGSVQLKARPSNVMGNSVAASVNFKVPIAEWDSDATFLAAIPVEKIAIIRDEKAANTNGGTSSVSYITRDLNTTYGDTDIVSLSSNEFTLQAGKYDINWRSPAAGNQGNHTNGHVSRLYNVTDAAEIITSDMGFTRQTASGEILNSYSEGNAVIEITSAKTYRIEHKVGTAKGGDGLGVAANIGTNEVYTTVKIRKLK